MLCHTIIMGASPIILRGAFFTKWKIYLVPKVVIVFSVLVLEALALREDSNYVSPNSKYKAIRELEVGVLQLWHFHKLTAILLLP